MSEELVNGHVALFLALFSRVVSRVRVRAYRAA